MVLWLRHRRLLWSILVALATLLLTLLLLGCLTLTASADVLWEPDEDPVYDYETAQTIARIYDVPADQTVNFYASPNDSQPAAVLHHGQLQADV